MKQSALRLVKMKAEEKEVRALLQREFAASLMKNTKWRELADALQGMRLQYSIKFVDVAEPKKLTGFWSATPRYLDSSALGPFLILSIEWLDIDPFVWVRRGHLLEPEVSDYTQEIEHRLQSIGVHYHQEGEYLRVTGHIRNTNPLGQA